jgi:hypothetical protein
MGKHTYHAYCLICGKVRCAATLPGLPKVTDDEPTPRPTFRPVKHGIAT